MRTEFERLYVGAFSAEAHPLAVAAYNATPPVRRKFFPGARGLYRAGDHYVVAPPRWRGTVAGRVWVGIVAHELGHAIDFFGRDAGVGRSIWLAPAIRQDRAGHGLARSAASWPSWPDPHAGRALGIFPEAARRRLVLLAGDERNARVFAAWWEAGQVDRALAYLSRVLAARRGREEPGHMALAGYGVAKVRDFLGAVHDLERGAGHSRAYYRGHGQILGPALTIGHVAEAFANAFMADVIEGTELFSCLLRQAAPNTHAVYRMLVARIGREGATAET